MAPKNNNNYYDPVGSQQNQPNSYTYQQASGTSNAGYASSNATTHPSHNLQSGYSSQYGGAQASRRSANDTAVAVLSSLSLQEYAQMPNNGEHREYGSTLRTPANNQQAQRGRLQAESSYGSQPNSGTFGRLSMLNGSNGVNGLPSTSPEYSTIGQERHGSWYSQQPQQQQQQQQSTTSQWYASLWQAGQAQQQSRSQQSQSSMTQQSYHSNSQHTQQRQQSGSVETPEPTTVDPSHVYDIQAERQRKAQIELEKQRKRDEAAAARKAEEYRIAEAKRTAGEAARKLEEEKLAADAARRLAEAKAVEKVQKAAAEKKAREEKKQSTSAAATLATMASTGKEPRSTDVPVDEEAEMRAMFLKLRQFNAKNPQMLAKLWEEERLAHTSPSPQQLEANARPAPTAIRPPANTARPEPLPSRAANPAPAPMRPTPQGQKSQQQKAAPATATKASSLCPPHKAGNLSEVAATWLMSLASNAGKTVHKDDLLNILRGNPSYVQFCEALEARGLIFERAQLARELLKPVSDSEKAHDSTRARQGHKGGTVVYRVNLPKKKDVATVSYEAPSVKPVHAPYAYSGPTQAPGRYMAQGGPVMPPAPAEPHLPPAKTAEIKDEVRAERSRTGKPPRPPANKEEAARKRTFTDLVDLTADDSDDDVPPMKMLKFARPPHSAPAANGHYPGMGDPIAPKAYGYAPPVPGLSNYKRAPEPSNHSHPTVPPPVINKGPSFEYYQQQNRIKGKMLVEPIMRDRVARKSAYDPKTIARDVLLATGRHPDMRGLNLHLAPLEKLLGSHGGSYDAADGAKGNRSDLSTIRWDLIDPEPPAQKRPVTSAANGVPAIPIDHPALIPDLQEIDADDELENELSVVSQHAVDNGDGTMSMAAVYGSRGPVKGVKGRGRPPGSGKLRKMPSSDQLSTNKSATGGRKSATSTEAPQPREKPAGTGETATAPIGYAAFPNLDENGVKKKGRPVGWRKSIHSREALGLTPAKPGSSSAPSGLRPTKGTDGELKVPKYQVYKCMWLNCPAELHNLATLKKHIVKVHGKPSGDGGFECLWQGCEGANGKGKGIAGSSDGVLSFDALGDLMGHVDETHLQPVAWKMGDGPRGGQSDFHETTDSEAYLSDAHGRSVTPVIRPDVPPPSSRVVPNRPTDRDEKKAAEELRKLEERKELVGFTMEKSGSTLATSKRRRGFMDDEDFEDVIHEEEPDPWA